MYVCTCICKLSNFYLCESYEAVGLFQPSTEFLSKIAFKSNFLYFKQLSRFSNPAEVTLKVLQNFKIVTKLDVIVIGSIYRFASTVKQKVLQNFKIVTKLDVIVIGSIYRCISRHYSN